MIEDLIQYYRHKFHTPITLATTQWQIDNWDYKDILVGLPVNAEQIKHVQQMRIKYDLDFGLELNDRQISVGRTLMGTMGKNFLILFFNPQNKKAKDYARQMVNETIPKMARYIRQEQLKQFTKYMQKVGKQITTDKQSAIDGNQFEVDNLSRKIRELYRTIETDRLMLKFYDRSEEQLKHKVIRMFVDLQKLVPGLYSCFSFKDSSIIGITYPINIWFEDHQYHFDPYTVEFHIETGHINISGDENEIDGYPHPHISNDNICWGNIATTISRLTGQLELHGLFQLIHEFLSTYNADDPFLRIEKWNPDWVDQDEDQPYCSYCDCDGHDTDVCEYCWWCEDCNQYHDVDDHVCPNREEEANEQAA